VKIYVAQYQPNRVGGGWTFADNFVKGMGDSISGDYSEADIYFIPSPSMVQRDEVQQAKADGKKIVLRLDNAVRNSRNRNTGMTRMKDFCDMADLVIYQSDWSREYLLPFTKKDGLVILNGVDLDLYKALPENNIDQRQNNIFYSRFNRDETKNWEAARYWFSQYQLQHPDATLHIAGQFSDELRTGNFDFYNNEHYQFYGVLSPQDLSNLYRISSLLYTYFNDACSNTLIEALVSRSPIVGDKYYRNTGGATQIREMYRQKGRDYFSIERMCRDYKYAIGGVL